MNQKGRRIYYDISTGVVIVEIAESYGFFPDKTVEEEIATYKALSERNRDTFDYIELEYGQYAQDFAECNGYRVNPETKTLEFSYPDPNAPEEPPIYQKPLSEQIAEIREQLARLNGDTNSYLDFYFSQFPEQA